MELHKKQTVLWWLFLIVLVALTITLGALQYRSIGAVSVAEHERLKGGLDLSLQRLSVGLNTDLTNAMMAIVPPTEDAEAGRAVRYAERFLQWRESSAQGRLIRRVVLVRHSETGGQELTAIDRDANSIVRIEWPSDWAAIRPRLTTERDANARIEESDPRRFRPHGPFFDAAHNLLAFPVRVRRGEAGAPEPGPGPGPGPGRRPPELDHWMIAELDADYIRSELLPELIQKHLSGSSGPVYLVQASLRDDPGKILFSSEGGSIGPKVDASVNALEVYWEQIIFRRMDRGRERGREPREGGPGGGFGGKGPGREFREGGPPRDFRESGRGPKGARAGPPPFPSRGHWTISVRHKQGSLEAAVDRARNRNLAVTGALVLLIVTAAGALVVLSRRVQRLARLQMDFVAGVSHELRTPLTVINMAAHNLASGVVKPEHMKRYGAVIKEKTERLNQMIEETLRFASAKAGRVIGERKVVALEPVIEDALDASSHAIDHSHCTVEKTIADGLPAVNADSKALSHALQNLIRNAVKHGGGGDWVGLAVRTMPNGKRPSVEILVEDRGAGIPQDELKYIFDPFYRGKRAMEDQVEGTGLGLSLVKRIIEAHDGTISVESRPNQGTRFVVHLPGTWEQTDEPADPFS